MGEAGLVRIFGLIVALMIAGGGLYIIHDRLTKMNQGIGDNTLKAIGTVLLLSTIIALASVLPTGEGAIAALAALLGTVAGYVLSKSEGRRD